MKGRTDLATLHALVAAARTAAAVDALDVHREVNTAFVFALARTVAADHAVTALDLVALDFGAIAIYPLVAVQRLEGPKRFSHLRVSVLHHLLHQTSVLGCDRRARGRPGHTRVA